MVQDWEKGRDQKVSENKWKWTPNNSNIWDTAKVVLRGKFIAIQAYLKRNRNISNKQPNPTPTRTQGTTTKTAQSK